MGNLLCVCRRCCNALQETCCCCCEENYEYPIVFEVKKNGTSHIVSYPEIPVKYSYVDAAGYDDVVYKKRFT